MLCLDIQAALPHRTLGSFILSIGVSGSKQEPIARLFALHYPWANRFAKFVGIPPLQCFSGISHEPKSAYADNRAESSWLNQAMIFDIHKSPTSRESSEIRIVASNRNTLRKGGRALSSGLVRAMR